MSLAAMPADNELKSSILASRKESEDGTIVTYDLTEGVDFSNPAKTAEALAEVFFEKDAVNWFKVSGEHIDFAPAYRVRVVMAEDHNSRLEETVDDFLEDLQKEEIFPRFREQIREGAKKESKLKTSMVASALSSLVFRHFDRKVYRGYVQDDLFVDILEKLEIRSLNNKDLMDWKHLPL